VPTADLFLRSRAWCVAGALMLAGRLAASEPETFVYKQVGPLAIRADVFRPANDGRKHPVVVWIHGGALIVGSRVREPGADRRIPDRLNAAGIVMVSIDYRLAPETKLPDILSDIEDAFRWVREQGPALFDADPAHLGVIGGSAGGYLTLTTGFRVKPRPDVLVSLWGYGDLIGPWYSEPSRQPRHNQFKVTREGPGARYRASRSRTSPTARATATSSTSTAVSTGSGRAPCPAGTRAPKRSASTRTCPSGTSPPTIPRRCSSTARTTPTCPTSSR
jgi:acetyl esterase/lipase